MPVSSTVWWPPELYCGEERTRVLSTGRTTLLRWGLLGNCVKQLFRDVQDYLGNEDMTDHRGYVHKLGMSSASYSAVQIDDLSYIILCNYLVNQG